MRKPDGLSAEEAVQGRSSLSALLSPGDFPAAPQTLLPGMRRKSVIPKSLAYGKPRIVEDDEDEDEDEVDNCPDLMGQLGIPELVTPVEEKDEPGYIASGEVERTPTPIPTEVPLPTTVTHLNPPGHKAAATKTATMSAKTQPSPRKITMHRDGQAKKGAASALSVGRVLTGGTLTSAGSRISPSPGAPHARDALADVHTYNEQAGASRGKEERRSAIPYLENIAV